ncbi:MAG: hypothetical protein ACREBN_00775 [Burkholderiaceae bacterium]
MTIRPLIAALAFVSIAAPLAAQADEGSVSIDTVFAIDQAVKTTKPQFDRKDYVQNIEGVYPFAPTTAQKQRSRADVLKELAAMPAERVGA